MRAYLDEKELVDVVQAEPGRVPRPLFFPLCFPFRRLMALYGI